jgi:hypothetical protein
MGRPKIALFGRGDGYFTSEEGYYKVRLKILRSKEDFRIGEFPPRLK